MVKFEIPRVSLITVVPERDMLADNEVLVAFTAARLMLRPLSVSTLLLNWSCTVTCVAGKTAPAAILAEGWMVKASFLGAPGIWVSVPKLVVVVMPATVPEERVMLPGKAMADPLEALTLNGVVEPMVMEPAIDEVELITRLKWVLSGKLTVLDPASPVPAKLTLAGVEVSKKKPAGSIQTRVPVAISPAKPSVRASEGRAMLLPTALSELMAVVAEEVTLAAAKA